VKDTVNEIMIKKTLPSLLLVMLIFILDRVSKYFILELSGPMGQLNIPVTSFINLNLVWNNGIAFGLLSFKENFNYNIITSVIIIVTLIIFWLSIKSKGFEKIGFLMILGGALGNIFDRIYYSSVIDFIDINYENFHWFIFNVADIFITLGIIMLIFIEIMKIKTHE
jgi:signal peptidase II|tara:strand:+ start:198 stop:698 length:501 start_codon:yes stop_codon:yes gene_type:complete